VLKSNKLLFLLALCCATPVTASAQTKTGEGWAFTCKDGSAPDRNGSCRRSNAAAGNARAAEIARRKAEEAAFAARMAEGQRKLEARRKAYADSVKRAEADKAAEQQRQAEKQAEFNRERDAGLEELKTTARSELDLKDAVRDAPSSELKTAGGSSGVGRAGSTSAQQQARRAVCAMDVIAAAVRHLEEAGSKELQFLSHQASAVIDGRKTEVQCKPKQLPPDVDVEKLLAKQKLLIQYMQTRVAAGEPEARPTQPARELTADEKRIQEAYQQQKKNEQETANKDAGPIAVQRAINEKNAQKYDLKDAQAIKREQDAKLQFKHAVEVLKAGDMKKLVDTPLESLEAIFAESAATKKQ
jgi:hypothetical protein